MKHYLLLFIIYLSFNFVKAQTPYLVKDLNANRDAKGQLFPRFFTTDLAEMNGIFYYRAAEDPFGEELWRTDGTPQGTYMLKDIIPGRVSSSPSSMAHIDNTLYFITNSSQLWKSDGTEEGTVLIKSFDSNSLSSTFFTKFNNSIFFITSRFDSGTKIWRTDGTENGTILIKTIPPGESSGINPTNFNTTKPIVINNTLFFRADDGVHGTELWKTDGTESGTTLVKDVTQGIAPTNTTYLVALDNMLYFDVIGQDNVKRLWSTDGTEQGTNVFSNLELRSSSDRRDNFNLVNLNGFLLFTILKDGKNQLWKTDGSLNGTVPIKEDINISSAANPFSSNTSKSSTNFYFGANDDTEIWKSDGTTEGTILVEDLNNSMPAKTVTNLTYGNNELFFIIEDSNNNIDRALWKTTNNDTNSLFVKNINPNSNNTSSISEEALFSSTSQSLAFISNSEKNETFEKLWLSDGSTSGTNAINTEFKTGTNNSTVNSFASLNGDTFFVTENALWKTNGTDDTTFIIKAFAQTKTLFNFNNALYLIADDGIFGEELWKSDGTEQGTVLVKDIALGDASSAINENKLLILDTALYFAANDGIHGNELWKSDGTEQGTTLVKDINPGDQSGMASHRSANLEVLNNSIYFAASDGIHGFELWKSDGTEQGTTMIKDAYPGLGSSNSAPLFITNANGTLFFNANDGIHGRELWKSDGTEQGTTLVKDVRSGEIFSFPSKLFYLNNVLFFSANDGINGRELWKSDGTEQGTTLVKDIALGTRSALTALPDDFVVFNNELYFLASDVNTTEDLWKSDGTEQGTVMVADVINGFEAKAINNLVVIDNLLYFSASDTINGSEIWKTDGTEEGTTRIDIAEGSEYNIPSSLTAVNNRIYFTAYVNSKANFYYGTELMALGNCTLNNTKFNTAHPIENKAFNSELQDNPSAQTCHCNLFNELISTTQATGNIPIVATNSNTVFRDEIPTANFVKRHYEIAPQNDISNTTGGVTLYFTQEEFDAFNALQTLRIPTSPTDVANAANIRIVLREGLSADGSGAVDTYPEGEATVITPEANAIVWNATDNRWEVSFDTQGFGGFWLTSAGRVLSTTQAESSKLTLSPNPTTSYIQLNGLKQKEPFTIYNMLGVAVQKGTAQNNTPISTAQLTQGLYILELDNGTSFKIIKR